MLNRQMLKSQLRKFSAFQAVFRDIPPLDAIKQKFEFTGSSGSIRDVLKIQESQFVTLNGWIDKKPKKVGKNLIFGTLRDNHGSTIQLVDTESLLKSSNEEDVVQIEGQLIPKKAKDNSEPQAYEVKLLKVRHLSDASIKASQLSDFKKAGNYPPEYRYLQLRMPKYQNFLKKRYEISKSVRRSLDSLGFTEMETPVLFKSTPEGAREFLVPTRDHQNGDPLFYALPQSPQQYKQLLMASGVNKYFQIAKCFRDEDLRADRQPEFTQIDLEMAFANGNDVMNVIEQTISDVWNSFSVNGHLHTLNKRGDIVSTSSSQPVLKLTYRNAMERYGIDKPDLRFPDLKIIDLTEFNAYSTINNEFPVFEILVLRNAFKSMEQYEQDWKFLSDKNNYNHRTPIVIPIENESMQSSWFEQFMSIATFENPKILTKFLNLKEGDIVCGCTREHSQSIFENPTPLGRLRQLVTQSSRGKELFRRSEHSVAAWIVDFPLFSPVEVESKEGSVKEQYPAYIKKRYCSTHHPFTMVQLSDYQKLHSNPLSCLGQHYDLVVDGVEVGGGSTRIHDPELQNYIFKEVLNIGDPKKLFGHLLTAFEMGTPPHAGFAIGFDRLCAMLCGTNSIRDVIAFPKSVSGADLVVGSPSPVPRKVLNEYHVDYRS